MGLRSGSMVPELRLRGRHLVMTAVDLMGRVMLAETIDLMQDYALRIGADFKIIQHENHGSPSLPKPHAVKFYSGLELMHYDRILWLDADCLVSPQCPDLFAFVPQAYAMAAWCGEIEAFESAERNRPRYRHGYFNSGVFLSSDPRPFPLALEMLADLERRLDPLERMMLMGEQTPLNKAVHELGIDVFPLGAEWNFLLDPMICAKLGIETTLQTAHIIHCAGGAHLQVQDRRCRASRAAAMRELRERLGW